ncbi:MAG: argininosuccinate synthase [Planctomycetes bacterium]|nr:argininosuccinate synthase [Planctomycetota bacterium]
MTDLDLTPLSVGDVLCTSTMTTQDHERVFATALALKADRTRHCDVLRHKRLAMIFEKDSLRTRFTFDVGMQDLGGTAVFMDHRDARLGSRESVKDVAKNLERWVHCIVARTFKHKVLEELAANADIPVINGLSDFVHPCQAMADFLTMREKWGSVKGRTLTYVGDGSNTCHSLIHTAVKLGTNIRVCSPEGYRAQRAGRQRGDARRQRDRRRGDDPQRPGRRGRRRRRDLHRRLGVDGSGGRDRRARRDLQRLPGRRRDDGARRSRRVLPALPAGPPRRGSVRGRDGRPAVDRLRQRGEPTPRAEGAARPADPLSAVRSTRERTEMSKKKKVVLAYSGGLDTSVIIPWLEENHGLEVHAFAGDVGQGASELEGLEDKAAATGAASCKVADLREEFLTDCVWPCLRALAVYEGRYLLGTSMARPVLAKGQVDYAKQIGAHYLAHGCTGKGNDQVRFELAYQALAPEMGIIAPWRDWHIKSREDAIDYAAEKGIPITASKEKIWSRDRNLWHISHEGGALEDPGAAPPEEVFMLTVDPRQAPDQPLELTLGFTAGVPTALNGEALPPEQLLARLNELGGQHGVGRVDITENRLVGMKSRGVYETPGGTIVYEALRTLRALTLERDTMRLCEKLMPDYCDLVYTGRWFHPMRRAMDALFADATQHVTGEVRVRLYKGSATAIAAESPFSLYSEDLATFGKSAAFEHKDSYGFVKLYGLPGAVAQRVQGGAS